MACLMAAFSVNNTLVTNSIIMVSVDVIFLFIIQFNFRIASLS